MVVGEGFEPSKSSDNRFTVCPLWPLGNPTFFYGADNRNRTDNLLITSQLLCQLSHVSIYLFYGGRNRDRTCDPLLVRQVLSQLSYATLLATPRGIEPLLPP